MLGIWPSGVFRLNTRCYDDLRNEAIRAGIGGIADEINSAVQNLALKILVREDIDVTAGSSLVQVSALHTK